MELLLRNVIAEVQESTVRKLLDTHRFRPIGLGLRIPDTQYVAYIIVECAKPNFHSRRLHIRVLKEAADRAKVAVRSADGRGAHAVGGLAAAPPPSQNLRLSRRLD